GLSAPDFKVTENGVPQTIAFCEFQKLDNTSPLPTLPRPTTPEALRLTRNQISSEPPGDLRYKDRRLLALYFDLTAMPVPDQIRSMEAARRSIATGMPPPDVAAILAFYKGSVHVSHAFTADRAELNEGMDALVASQSENPDSTAGDESD